MSLIRAHSPGQDRALALAGRPMPRAISLRRLGLQDRGLLRVGLAADVTVFDPSAIADRATFTDPHHYPVGVRFVVVNGQVTVKDGTHTGARAGRVLRGPAAISR